MGWPAFDIVNLKRKLDTLDPSIGPRHRNLHTSWALLQSVMSVVRELKYDDLGAGTAYADALRSKEWATNVEVVAEDMGFSGDNAILDFTAVAGRVTPLLHPQIVPGSLRIDYVDSTNTASYLVDDGAGILIDGGTAGDLAGTPGINYATGVITSLVFAGTKEPEVGQFTATYTQNAKATFEAHLLSLENALTSALAANQKLLKA